MLSFRSHHTNLFGLNYFGIQRHELETALNWYHSPNDYGKLWQIQNRRHSRHQKVLGFLNFPEMLIVWLNLFNVNSSKKKMETETKRFLKNLFFKPTSLHQWKFTYINKRNIFINVKSLKVGYVTASLYNFISRRVTFLRPEQQIQIKGGNRDLK